MPAITVATFNAGLLDGFIPHVRGRSAALARALAELDTDIVALQELWSADDRAAMIDASPLDHAVEADPPAGDPTGFGLDGAAGIVLLSRWPMLASSVVELDASLVRRAAIVAEIDAPGGPITVITTHLAANIRNVEHHGPDGWRGEHRRQVHQILRLAAEASGPVVLAGDLNCGPAHPSGAPEFEGNYDLLRSGFETSAYTDDQASACTWCDTNPLVAFDPSKSPTSILDHVMESGFSPTAWRRIFDQPTTVDGDDGPVTTMLSDHFGVAVTLELG